MLNPQPTAATASPRMSMLSVTIPVYNERENLRPLYDTITAVLRQLQRPWEIIFVDDGSTDGTAPCSTSSPRTTRRQGDPFPPQLRPDRGA